MFFSFDSPIQFEFSVSIRVYSRSAIDLSSDLPVIRSSLNSPIRIRSFPFEPTCFSTPLPISTNSPFESSDSSSHSFRAASCREQPNPINMVTTSAASSPEKVAKDANTSKSSKKSHPTYPEMIIEAVATLKKRDGSTLSAIRNYLKNNYLPGGVQGYSLTNAMDKLQKEERLAKVEKKKTEKAADRFKLTDSAKKELKPKSECC